MFHHPKHRMILLQVVYAQRGYSNFDCDLPQAYLISVLYWHRETKSQVSILSDAILMRIHPLSFKWPVH